MTEKTRTSQPRLGSIQQAVLKGMQREARLSTWYPGCGWLWDTTSGTRRIMEGLASKGIVERADEKFNRPGSPRETVTVYRLTDLGRAYDFKVD